MGMQDNTPFGQALKEALASRKFTQVRLANELETDPGQVSRWATGKSLPVRGTVERMGEILGVDLLEALRSSTPQYELYVSAPITGLSEDSLATHHDEVGKVVESLADHVNSLHWPGREINGTADLLAPDIATERNMSILAHSTALLYLQFAEVVRPTGSLIELGAALGSRKKTTIILKRGLRQPFMLQEFAAVAARLPSLPQARVYVVDSVDAACRLVQRNGRELLGLT
ncbi:MAG: helix-turn-helix transcriptional regulator [Microthrixaceae bacterium]|nr:helix-turn-helix transcriptional regulator [Microthrixaceae bacterium]